MITDKRKKAAGEMLRFIIVGVLATGLHYVLYYILQKYINVNVAYTLGYIISFLANFYLTAFFTFRQKPTLGGLFGMAGAHLVNYLLHMFLLNFFLWVGIREELAPFPVFAIAVPVNFILVRLVFKPKGIKGK